MIRPICISLLISGLLAACSDGDMPAQLGVSISIDLPDSVDPSTLSDALLTVYNVSNGSYTTLPVTNPANVPIDVLPGLYKISFSCHATLDNGAGAEVTGASHNCTITAATSISLKTYCVVVTDDLIISELFFTGTLQSSGNQYNGDQDIKLFNNTDHTIYADGLTIFESTFLTTQKFNYDPDVMPTAMTVQALYTIPGSGTDHPVEPGRELLIADIAIDHRAINPNSFDLSHADFEWYDESSNPKYADIDNPCGGKPRQMVLLHQHHLAAAQPRLQGLRPRTHPHGRRRISRRLLLHMRLRPGDGSRHLSHEQEQLRAAE